MNKAFSPVRTLSDEEWIRLQMEQYGPLLSGESLRAFLGFRSSAAFAKARAAGGLGLNVFSIPGRKGLFAVTTDACSWLLDLRRQASNASCRSDQLEERGISMR